MPNAPFLNRASRTAFLGREIHEARVYAVHALDGTHEPTRYHVGLPIGETPPSGASSAQAS